MGARGMSKKPESVFRLKVTAFLKTLEHTHFFPIQQKAIRGTPDFLLCTRGKFVALELKSESGGLSELQRYNLDRVLFSGGYAFVAYPKNWMEIQKRLKEIDE